MQHAVEVVLRACPVFIPPLAQRCHVVCGDGADTPVRVLSQVTEAHMRILRHALDFKTEDAQLVHHPCHAVGNHSEVFGTDQHTGGIHQFRKFLHRLLIPELVVAAIVIVVIEFVEHGLVAVVETFVNEVELNADARMEAVRVLVVAYEEHVADQGVETVANPYVRVRGLARKSLLHLALCVIRRTHLVTVAPYVLHVLLPHLVCMLAEDAVEHPVGNERLREQFLLPVQSVPFYLFTAHAESRRKLSEQSVNRADRNFPDAEEAEYVVDAVGIEILCHVPEAVDPPLAAVLDHFVPVVSRKSPVLSVYGEVIGRSTCLAVEVEVARFRPYVTAVAVHADGDVAFQDDLVCLCVLVDGLQLAAQHELYVIEERRFLIGSVLGVGQSLAVGLVPLSVVGPSREVSCPELVSHAAVLCVRNEPALRFGKECLEGFAFKHLAAFLFKEQPEVFRLRIVHTLIVNLRQCVEFLAQCLELLTLLFVFQCRQCVEVGILRM